MPDRRNLGEGETPGQDAEGRISLISQPFAHGQRPAKPQAKPGGQRRPA
jgi:hypothetical protein